MIIQKNFTAVARTLTLVLFLMLLLAGNPGRVSAQEPGAWGIGLAGTYSKPIGGLNDWFQAAPNWSLTIGKQIQEQWLLEGGLEYAYYNRENLQGYPAGKLELTLEHWGVLLGGRYRLTQISVFRPYGYFSAGLYQWEGVRGALLPDSTITPYLPAIAAKRLQAINWGVHLGAGMEVTLVSNLVLNFLAHYRFIVGDLWPTLQPHIELEGVSGFQTLNFSLALQYYF
ncbi:outer membrane beta-barrel protein [candidate division KSB1 bacterium]|nr:outer membrane beta-barrel protein [candidate division KSB1 bacterium]